MQLPSFVAIAPSVSRCYRRLHGEIGVLSESAWRLQMCWLKPNQFQSVLPLQYRCDTAKRANMNSPDYNMMRKHMIDSQLRTSGIADAAILTAMGRVPRERFVAADRAALAYQDRSIALGDGRTLNPPVSTAMLLDGAALKPSDSVLLIGAGSGYVAALLAGMVAKVCAVEENADLCAAARVNITALALENVELVEGALLAGSNNAASYDVIIIDGAVDQLPEALVAQLVEGGRLVTGQMRGPIAAWAKGIKRDDGVVLRQYADSEIAILSSFAKKPEFVF